MSTLAIQEGNMLQGLRNKFQGMSKLNQRFTLAAAVLLLAAACTFIDFFYNVLNPFTYHNAVNIHFASTSFSEGQFVPTRSRNDYTVVYRYSQYTSLRLNPISMTPPSP